MQIIFDLSIQIIDSHEDVKMIVDSRGSDFMQIEFIANQNLDFLQIDSLSKHLDKSLFSADDVEKSIFISFSNISSLKPLKKLPPPPVNLDNSPNIPSLRFFRDRSVLQFHSHSR